MNPGQLLQLPASVGVASANMNGDVHRKWLAVLRARAGQITVLGRTAAGEKVKEN